MDKDTQSLTGHARTPQRAVQQSAGRAIAERYSLVSQLGRGGMGIVWRAEDMVIGRHVAVKELRLPEGEQGPMLQERVRREVRAGGRLNDPAIVTVFDVIKDDDGTYIVMELVDAPTLSEIVREQGRLGSDWVSAIGEQVLSALSAAHGAGIVHRDVKPSNIMVDVHGRVKLSDFGIAHAVDDPRLTTSGFLIGSPAFTAPERVSGQEASPLSDIWSLGATLFFAAEGTMAFERETTAATLHAIMNDAPKLVHTYGPLATAIMGMLAPNPDARISVEHARELLARARTEKVSPTIVAGESLSYQHLATSKPTVGSQFAIPRNRRNSAWRKLAGIGAAALIFPIGFGAGVLWESPSSGGWRDTIVYGEGGTITEFTVTSGCVNAPLDGRPITRTTDCSNDHDFEVFAERRALTDSETVTVDYLEDELIAWAERGCELSFRSNLVDADMRAEVEFVVLVPSRGEWERVTEYDDFARSAYCVAVAKDGGRLSGSILVDQ